MGWGMDYNIYAIVGFLLAAYAVVGNDALQTLGTFINSNKRLHWFPLFLFASVILVVVFMYGWMVNDGDPSFGRLSNTSKYPVIDAQWYHCIPPLALLVLTRLGVPVSTTFMVLTSFATLAGLQSMLVKSMLGYIVAFGVGLGIYVLLAPTLERFFLKTEEKQHARIWVVLQWLTTGYLWTVWLMQDFANIFVFLPCQLSSQEAGYALAAIVVLLMITFANKGGPVQRILRSKTSVTDIRSATLIDFFYATILFYFKEMSDIPMSTTWVFLGLIGGREYAIATIDRVRSFRETSKIVLLDGYKGLIGLVVSVVLALGLPRLAEALGM